MKGLVSMKKMSTLQAQACGGCSAEWEALLSRRSLPPRRTHASRAPTHHHPCHSLPVARAEGGGAVGIEAGVAQLDGWVQLRAARRELVSGVPARHPAPAPVPCPARLIVLRRRWWRWWWWWWPDGHLVWAAAQGWAGSGPRDDASAGCGGGGVTLTCQFGELGQPPGWSQFLAPSQ